MSGEINDRLEFDEPQFRLTTAARYEDDAGSLWNIMMTGEQEAVEQFVELRSFFITSEEFNPRDKPTNRTYNGIFIPDIQNEELRDRIKRASAMLDENREYGEEIPPEAMIDRRNDLIDIPTLEFDIRLVEPAFTPPFRVAFLLDPPLAPAGSGNVGAVSGQSSSWAMTFYLGGGTSRATVGFGANYPVNISLSSGLNYGNTFGTRGQASVPGNENWSIYVSNQVPQQNSFTLTGDLQVYN